MRRESDNNIAEGAGLDPDKQHLLRQLKAGERVLMKVHQERNKTLKENQRLRRGIYSKCLRKFL